VVCIAAFETTVICVGQGAILVLSLRVNPSNDLVPLLRFLANELAEFGRLGELGSRLKILKLS
jgi:hypothetical protein